MGFDHSYSTVGRVVQLNKCRVLCGLVLHSGQTSFIAGPMYELNIVL